MVDDESGTQLSGLHMIVLGRIAHRGMADVEDIARWLGVPVVVAETLCADVARRGLLAPGEQDGTETVYGTQIRP